MNRIELYKKLSFEEEYNGDDIFYPQSIFWDNNLDENIIYNSWKKLIESKRDNHGIGIYIHYPFCSTICTYCFNDKELYNKKKSNNYILLLEKEIGKFKDIFNKIKIKNIYIGGGTPSLMTTTEIKKLFFILNKNFNLSCIEQITIEVAPSSLTKEKLLILKENGVNRIVFGIQSLDNDVLKVNNRFQPIKRVIDLINYANEINIPIIKVDLIAGLPGDTYESFRNTLSIIEKDMKINEIAVYPFCPHSNTNYIKKGGFYSQHEIIKREKMLKISKIYTDKINKNNYYNKQIIEEEAGKLSILGIGYMAISKIFGECIYKKESYSDYKNWVLDNRNINFSGIKYDIKTEMINYIINNIKKMYLDDFYNVFGIDFKNTKYYNTVLLLKKKGIILENSDRKGKFIMFKYNSELYNRLFAKFFYSEENINKFINRFLFDEKRYNNIDFKLKQVFGNVNF